MEKELDSALFDVNVCCRVITRLIEERTLLVAAGATSEGSHAGSEVMGAVLRRLDEAISEASDAFDAYGELVMRLEGETA